MSDTKKELLSSILADPASDEARLVYADFLLEQGDPRGEFINAQVGLASKISPARRKELKQKYYDLKNAHEAEWGSVVNARSVLFQRGFIDRICVDASTFIDNCDAMIAIEPIRAVELESTDLEQLERLAERDSLGQIKCVTIRGYLEDEGIETLVAAPWLKNVENLNLTSIGVSSDGAATFAKSENVTGLKKLTLTDNPIASTGFATIIDAKNLENLEVLFVPRCEIDDEGLTHLADKGHPNLQKLGIGSNDEISDAGILALVDSTALPALKRVELQSLYFSLETYDRLPAGWS